MKHSSALLLLGGIVALSATAQAQIIMRVFDVTGVASESLYHPTVRVYATADITANTYKLEFQNTFLGTGNYQGTITSFGFNTPFSDAQLGSDGSNVSFTQLWTQLLPDRGGVQPATWNIFEPYDLSQGGGLYAQDIGDGTGNTPQGGNPGDGIRFGEIAVFTFQFADFTSADGFFDSATDISVRWQQVGTNGSFQGSDYGGGNDRPPPSEGEVPVPEPSTYGLLAAGALVALAVYRRFRRQVA
jgi:hypothetical protein